PVPPGETPGLYSRRGRLLLAAATSDFVPGRNDEAIEPTSQTLVVMKATGAAHGHRFRDTGAGKIDEARGGAAGHGQIGVGRVNDADESAGAAHILSRVGLQAVVGDVGRAA